MIIDVSQFCIFGGGDTSSCEFWGPTLVIRDDGTRLLYVTGHQVSGLVPRVYLATSTDGGNTFNFAWSCVGTTCTGVLDDSLGAYRFGAVTSQPGGPLVYYAASNTDNHIYRFTSSDGLTWVRANDIGYWGFDFHDVKDDTTHNYYIATLAPMITISDDCSTPTWQYAPIVLSADGSTGVSFSSVFAENYFYGWFSMSGEFAVLSDQKGLIQGGTPQLLYFNSNPNQSCCSGNNSIMSVDWRRGSGVVACSYP